MSRRTPAPAISIQEVAMIDEAFPRGNRRRLPMA